MLHGHGLAALFEFAFRLSVLPTVVGGRVALRWLARDLPDRQRAVHFATVEQFRWNGWFDWRAWAVGFTGLLTTTGVFVLFNEKLLSFEATGPLALATPIVWNNLWIVLLAHRDIARQAHADFERGA